MNIVMMMLAIAQPAGTPIITSAIVAPPSVTPTVAPPILPPPFVAVSGPSKAIVGRFVAGAATCDSTIRQPMRRVEPLAAGYWRYAGIGFPQSEPRPTTLRFDLDASGRPTNIRAEGASTSYPVDSGDVAPAGTGASNLAVAPRMTIMLRPGAVTLGQLRDLWAGASALLSPDALERIDAAAASVDRIVAGGKTVYGINTGFGLLAQTRIPADKLGQLQRNLILSHSCGLGDALPRNTVRMMILLKLIGLGRGHSGVRRTVIDALQHLLDADALPVIPAQGSVGASGDLAPLAHMVAALMGEGRIDFAGELLPATDALRRLGRDALVLAPKEGLALINGTQASTAIALDALFLGERVFGAALDAGALSVDALKGSCAPFDERIHALRGQPGQIAVAARLRDLLDGSDINTSHHDCDRVQDPYSFRCQPQVMGAALDLLTNAARTLVIEANAVTDNPILFPDSDEVISGGNFHAQPVAFAADIIAMALCEVGSISERRTSVLVDPHMSRLPAFLTDDGGLNSGLMIPQVTAAALVSENKSLAFPASVDSIPTSAGQEDHVSMAPIAARKAVRIARNAAGVVAIELIAAAQGVDYHAPLRTSRALQAVHEKVRALSPHLQTDRYWADEMAALQGAVLAGSIGSALLL